VQNVAGSVVYITSATKPNLDVVCVLHIWAASCEFKFQKDGLDAEWT
jgi:hypothetical protein